MKCPKCSRRKIITYRLNGELMRKCRKCRHTWKPKAPKTETE